MVQMNVANFVTISLIATLSYAIYGAINRKLKDGQVNND